MKGDLAIRPGPEAMARRAQLALDPLEVVKLPVHHDVPAAVLARDRLVARGEVDDAEPCVAEADAAVRGDPVPLPVGAPVVQSGGGVGQGDGRDAAVRVVDRNDAAHQGVASIRDGEPGSNMPPARLPELRGAPAGTDTPWPGITDTNRDPCSPGWWQRVSHQIW